MVARLVCRCFERVSRLVTLMTINLDGLRTGGSGMSGRQTPNLGGPELVSWLEGVRGQKGGGDVPVHRLAAQNKVSTMPNSQLRDAVAYRATAGPAGVRTMHFQTTRTTAPYDSTAAPHRKLG